MINPGLSSTTIGLLHPGEMGATLGAAARLNDAQLVWASAGRSPQTHRRAEEAGLRDLGSVSALLERSHIVLSVCPPHAAAALAVGVASRRFSGVYVDANAVSPATSRDIRQVVEAGGAGFVDGAIIGPPALKPGTTRLYLCGAEAERVAACFRRGPLEAIILDGRPGAASALKMSYAAYTKGAAALLIAIRTLAIHEGVDAALSSEWERSQPGLAQRSAAALRANARKAWRFRGEMEEIADTFAAAGLPDGFHRAAAEVYSRLSGYKDTPQLPSLEEAAGHVLSSTASEKT